MHPYASYASGKVAVRALDHPKNQHSSASHQREQGVFAIAPIVKNELVIVWGGDVITAAQLRHYMTLEDFSASLCVQIEEDLYLMTPPEKKGPGDWINHSCQPNIGMQGQICLVAMRDIEPGEELCIDYAMADGSSFDEFRCYCNAPHCRHFISGQDWRNPKLWQAYAGYFSPYLQRRIDLIAKTKNV